MTPPIWLGLDAKEYLDLLRRKAVAVTRRDKKRGGIYSVRDAIEAIHSAFEKSNGTDPYDGEPMDPTLLGQYNNADSKAQGAEYKKRFARLPTIDHVDSRPVAIFEIVSWQTNDAKGDMAPEEFVEYCRRVVATANHSDNTSRDGSSGLS